MGIGVESFTVNKRFPLTISRQTTPNDQSLVTGGAGGHRGLGGSIAKPDSSASISGEEPLLDTE